MTRPWIRMPPGVTRNNETLTRKAILRGAIPRFCGHMDHAHRLSGPAPVVLAIGSRRRDHAGSPTQLRAAEARGGDEASSPSSEAGALACAANDSRRVSPHSRPPLSSDKSGAADHLQKNGGISGHFGPLRQRRRRHGALRQWLFHPPVTQARLHHPTFCP